MNPQINRFNQRALTRTELLSRFTAKKKPTQDKIEKAAALVVSRMNMVIAPQRCTA
jgi:hypothetical protein